jgi:hypothetical protein
MGNCCSEEHRNLDTSDNTHSDNTHDDIQDDNNDNEEKHDEGAMSPNRRFLVMMYRDSPNDYDGKTGFYYVHVNNEEKE